MKKTIILIFALLLIVSSAVCAQDIDTAVSELNATTLRKIFKWGDSFDDINKMLSRYDLEIDADKETMIIYAEPMDEDKAEVYSFYFDDETGDLYMADCYIVMPENIAMADVIQILNDAYHLTDLEKYSDELLELYISDFDGGNFFADKDTIIAVAFSEETDEEYAAAYLAFFDRQYMES